MKAQLQVASPFPPCDSYDCNPEEDAHGGESWDECVLVIEDAMHPQARSFVANRERGGGVDEPPSSSSFIALSARREDNRISRSPSVRSSVRPSPAFHSSLAVE